LSGQKHPRGIKKQNQRKANLYAVGWAMPTLLEPGVLTTQK